MSVEPAKSNTFAFGDNPEVAVISLWTPTDFIAKKLDKKQFGIIGNLYSAERGIDSLARSLLSNPQIRYLVITGVDTAKSGQVLSDFFENGFEKGKTRDSNSDVWKIKSSFEGYLDLDIAAQALEELRSTITVVKWNMNEPFSSLTLVPPEKNRVKQVFEKKSTFVKKYFGEGAGYIFRHPSWLESWLLCGDSLLKFGIPTPQNGKKLYSVLFVINLDKSTKIALPEFFPYSFTDCQSFSKALSREINLETIVRGLQQDPPKRVRVELQNQKGIVLYFSRQNNRVLLQVFLDQSSVMELPRLLVGLQLMLQQSWSMGSAFWSNAVISVSAAELEATAADVPALESLVESQVATKITHPGLLPDIRGNFVVYISQGEIVVEHLSAGNELLYMYVGKTALSLRDQLMRENIVGTVAHGFYLGTELQKAEIALKLGFTFVQDKPLDFESREKK